MFNLFNIYLIFPLSPWSCFLGDFLIYSKQKELRNLNLTCQGAFGGSVFITFSAWQPSSAQFSKNWWLLRSCYLWKANTLVFLSKQSTTQGKSLFSQGTHTLIWAKVLKKENLCQFMGDIKRVLSFLCSLGNGQRPPNSFHKGCYKSSSQ